MRTGFTEAELFRKYLWYLLRERTFDAEAVADLVHLCSTLGLSDEQVPHPTSIIVLLSASVESTIMFSSLYNVPGVI